VPDLNLMPENILFQHQPIPIPAMVEMANLDFHLNEVLPQDPISMEVESFGDGLESQGQSVPQEKEQDPQPVPDLPASPLKFPHLDILFHELNATDSQGDENDDSVSLSCQASVPTQQGSFLSGIEGNSSASIQELGTLALSEINPTSNGSFAPVEPANTDLQLGMVMLPNDLVVDPRFSALENSLPSSRPHPDGVRLWAKRFAPLDMSEGINIPKS
jgi:hypothetical protein